MQDNLNFRQASRTVEEHDSVLTALTNDFRKLMKKGGVSAIDAHPKFKMRAGALIRREVENSLAYSDVIPLLFERREAELGDTVEFEYLINTMRVVRYAPHSHPLVQTPRKNKYTIGTNMYELAFGIPLQKVLTGQHDIGTYVQHAAEALNRHRLVLGLEAVDTAVTGATDPAGRALRDTVGAPDVDESTLKSAIRRLQAAGAGNIRVFGTRWALDPIMDFTAAKSEGLAEDLARRGVIGFYRGAQLVEIGADYNPYYDNFPTINGADLDSILVLAADMPGGIFLERDLSALDWQELDPEKAQFRTGTRMDHGILVHEAWKYHVIEMTG